MKSKCYMTMFARGSVKIGVSITMCLLGMGIFLLVIVVRSNQKNSHESATNQRGGETLTGKVKDQLFRLSRSSERSNGRHHTVENVFRIEKLENMVKSLLKGQIDLQKMLIIESDNQVKSLQEVRSKRAIDDDALHDVKVNNSISVDQHNSGHMHTTTGFGGAIYVRWGRTSCLDENIELVYSGIAGGSFYNHEGSSVNTLCLPHDPVWGRYDDTLSEFATIYGGEYTLWNDGHKALFKNTNAELLNDHNIPCAVCRSVIRSSVFMLPGRNVCYKGWHTEYHGYLMGCHKDYKASSEFICMDEAPEADPAGFRDENGKIFFPVEGVCGSLPCPPYVNGRELTCVVCSK